MLLINNQEVEKLFDMKSCLQALEDGYDDLLKGDAVYRPRLDVWMPCERADGYYRWGTGPMVIRKKNTACSLEPGVVWSWSSACATANRWRSSTTV